MKSCVKERSGSFTTKTLAKEALTMYRYYENKYLTLMMTWVDDDRRMEQIIDDVKLKSDRWRERWESLTK